MRPQSIFLVGLGGLLGLGAVLAASLVLKQPYAYQGTYLEPAVKISDFTLTDPSGVPFRLNDQRGGMVLLFFGYTSCPDVCPATLADFRKVHTLLGDQAQRVQFVFVTVDPERDSPQQVGEYVSRFHQDFVGLSGTLEDLEPVWESFFVFREIPTHHPGEHYLVDHSGFVYALDPAGQLRLTFSFGTSPDAIAQDVLHLLDQG